MGDAVTRQTTSELAEPTHAYDLFVVYATIDAEFVRGYLLPALNLPSSRVLLIDELPLGGVIVSEVDRSVTQSRFTVAVLSPAYLADRWAVFGEQLASHLSVDDTRIIPLRRTPCDLPLRLDARVSLDFTDGARWEAEAERLRDLVRAAPPAPEPISCPYPGMRAFGAADVGRFFGRDHEVDDLVGRLDRGERAIYVIGPSGSGKSSLVQAGLLPVIEAGSSRLGRTFVARTMRPGERPTERLAKALEGDLSTPAQVVDAFVARYPPAERVLMFVDQVEELFTLASGDERQQFIEALQALRVSTPCCFVLALRADFYGALMDSALWPQRASISRLDVAPLRGEALAEAIIAPAMRVGVHLEARLSDRLVADAADEPGVLPLVQETLRMLWDKRRHHYLGLAEYEALGNGGQGLYVAIAMRANTAMNELAEEGQQAIARRVLLRLVSFGEGRADTRRQLGMQALRSAADDDAALSLVLQHLVAHRLVTVDGDPTDEQASREALVDLSHEALITAWAELGQWIRTHRADEQRRRQFEAAAAHWVEHGRGARGLLDPSELADAETWQQTGSARQLGQGADVNELIAASRAEHMRRENERREQASKLEASERASRRLLAQMYAESGRQLLLDGRPQEAIPYLLQARRNGIDNPPLHVMFWAARRGLPLLPPLGHKAKVMSAAFSPDGTRVVTASYDKTARVWDAATGKPLTSPLEHQWWVVSAAFNREGTRVVTASHDKTARVWDAATGKPLTIPLEHPSPVVSAAFSPDGTRVVTASRGQTAWIWDVATGKALTGLHLGGWWGSAAFSPDGTRVVTASGDDTARVWDAATGKLLTSTREHQHQVTSAAFSPDGTCIVTASSQAARIWDAATGKPLTNPLEHQGPVGAAAFSPDGTLVVTASWDKTARVWDVATGEPLTIPLEHQGWVVTAAFSPDGTRVITASRDKTARVWDAITGEPLTIPLEHQGWVAGAAFSPDGTRVVTASRDNTARVWDAATGKAPTSHFEHQDKVVSAAFSPDGTRAITASWDKTARVWDAATGKPLTSPLHHQGHVSSAAFSADGTRVITVSSNAAWIWDAATGKPLTSLINERGGVGSASFSVDGTRVVTSEDKTARVWDAATGKPVTGPLVHQQALKSAAFSADGTRVVTASSDNTARIWDATTGNPLTGSLVHEGEVVSAAFNPDGTRVVTASSDNTARVWDAATGNPLTGPLVHQGQVWRAAFSPDGTRVVTASEDNTARVWDTATGKPLTGPLVHEGEVVSAAFSPDGTRVVTASWDNTARVWDAGTGKPLTSPLAHQEPVVSAAFSPDGTRVVTTSHERIARMWDVRLDTGTLEEWCAIAERSPFVLEGAALVHRSPTNMGTKSDE